jgi:(1->4)-alpha-D-glucan 1-alpha-D-glucosylmutase
MTCSSALIVVDYARSQDLFECVQKRGDHPDSSLIECLMKSPEDGRIKQYAIWMALRLRQQQPDLFQKGGYMPLAVAGAKAKHVVAFARRLETASILVIVQRLVCSLLNDFDVVPLGSQVWGDTRIAHPPCNPETQYRNLFTGEILNWKAEIDVSRFLSTFPVAPCQAY